MDKGYEKEQFKSISIKASVVKKFRKYSRSISKSNLMTLKASLFLKSSKRVSLRKNSSAENERLPFG